MILEPIDAMRQAALPVRGLIHVGANDGQERYLYSAAGIDPCVYIEPISAIFTRLKQHLEGMDGHVAVQALCSDVAGEAVEFHIADNNGLSSSMLPLGKHAEIFPSVAFTGSERMVTRTLDEVVAALQLARQPNTLVIDTQGADLKVLRGAGQTLMAVNGLFIEVSEQPLYIGGCNFAEIKDFVEPLGFRLRALRLDPFGHGDAFFSRDSIPTDPDLPTYGGDLALGRNAAQSSYSVWSHLNDAQGAVNGRRTGSFGFHTDLEDKPWWQVDLGGVHPLSEIRVYNRLDEHAERARSMLVMVSADGSDWRCVHSPEDAVFGGVDGRPLRVLLGEDARVVRLQLQERNYLHLDAVEVY